MECARKLKFGMMIHHNLVNLFGYSMVPFDLDRNFQGHWYRLYNVIYLTLIWGRVINGQFSQDFGIEHIIF